MGKLTAHLSFFPNKTWKPGLALSVPVPLEFPSENEAANIPFSFLLSQDGVHVLLHGQNICVIPSEGLYFHPLKFRKNKTPVPPDCSIAVKQAIQNTPVLEEDETVSLPYSHVFEKIRDELVADDLYGDYEAYTFTAGH